MLDVVLRLHMAAINSNEERINEGCDIPANSHAPEVGLIKDTKFL